MPVGASVPELTARLFPFRYEKAHAAGKTDEARKDLERLAIIRKQRAEAAEKKKALAAAKEAAKSR